jgi:hypothetical protein
MGDAAEILVTDITAELVGERREEWRDGVDYGLKQGTNRVLQSPAMQEIALELELLRALYAATCEALDEAQHQIGVLEAELDYRAPGWDRVAA